MQLNKVDQDSDEEEIILSDLSQNEIKIDGFIKNGEDIFSSGTYANETIS